jgi:hypothetical protein
VFLNQWRPNVDLSKIRPDAERQSEIEKQLEAVKSEYGKTAGVRLAYAHFVGGSAAMEAFIGPAGAAYLLNITVSGMMKRAGLYPPANHRVAIIATLAGGISGVAGVVLGFLLGRS